MGIQHKISFQKRIVGCWSWGAAFLTAVFVGTPFIFQYLREGSSILFLLLVTGVMILTVAGGLLWFGYSIAMGRFTFDLRTISSTMDLEINYDRQKERYIVELKLKVEGEQWFFRISVKEGSSFKAYRDAGGDIVLYDLHEVTQEFCKTWTSLKKNDFDSGSLSCLSDRNGPEWKVRSVRVSGD